MNEFTRMVVESPAPDWFIDTIVLREAESAILFRVTWACATDEFVSREVNDYSRRFMRAVFDMTNGDWP